LTKAKIHSHDVPMGYTEIAVHSKNYLFQ